ncbi:MipA/OmpV family protein [Aurantiacibacter aquimixticola]|uniref:MipA/OmpV family protein n=2 Tax=Aurantiacibacter aquimixticola TaxID=1958945 RepID=A0A419RX57_9SPHN|nr:MipA/OmpV family protein [Aurantiacibacter aquimixticola]
MCAAPAMAQDIVDEAPPPVDAGVFGGDFVTVGVGAAYSPSYTGSDDYVISVLPVVLGSLGGIDISPRAGGVSVDFIEDERGEVGFDLGIAARLRGNRASRIEDPIVESYGELDRAIEVGPSVGVNFPAVLNPYDSVSIGTDVMFDINGAHGGTVVTPSVAYTTPLSRAILANLSVSTEWASADFQEYYFAVPEINTLLPDDDLLPGYETDGGGFTSIGTNLLLGIDLDGDVTNGGLGLLVLGGYSRLVGDAADTPFTDIRGSKDQFLIATGLTYTF